MFVELISWDNYARWIYATSEAFIPIRDAFGHPGISPESISSGRNHVVCDLECMRPTNMHGGGDNIM